MRALHRRTRRPPDCRQVARIMQAYLDGELPPGDTALVAAHLEDCERCGVDAEVYRRVKAAIGRLRTAPDPDAVRRLRGYAQELPGRETR